MLKKDTQEIVVVSIIIANFNGKEYLAECLPSIFSQQLVGIELEVIVVDNGSSDGSLDLLETDFKQVRLIKLKNNTGFVGATNAGMRKATGDYFLLLNNDTVLPKNFIQEFVHNHKSSTGVGISQPKIKLYENPHQLDAAGGWWTTWTFLYHRGLGQDSDDPEYNKPVEVFTVKGAAMLFDREVYQIIGELDPDFWSYYEETDFCHRALLAGFKVMYLPKPGCLHHMGATASMFDQDLLFFHNIKNKIRSYLKNFYWWRAVLSVTILITISSGFAVIRLMNGKISTLVQLIKAVGWNIRHLTQTLRFRGQVQRLRKFSDAQYLANTARKVPISYLYYMGTGRIKEYYATEKN